MEARLISAAASSASGLSKCNEPGELETVSKVELNRYMGKWYEIARYDNRFQRGTVATTTVFSLDNEGMIQVEMTARKKTVDGKMKESTATGWIVDENSNAKWKVQFFWPLRSDYWIIELCDDYKFAVIGQPTRKNVWIISREPEMDEATYKRLCRRLKRHGFDPEKLVRTPHPDQDKSSNARLANSNR